MEGTRSGLPLLAASARPRAGVLLAGCAVLVAVLGARVRPPEHGGPVRPRRRLPGHRLVRRPSRPGPVARLSRLDDSGRRADRGHRHRLPAHRAAPRRRAGHPAVPVDGRDNRLLLKPLVHRTYIGQVVYPSGHTATIFALAATVTVLLLASAAAGRWRARLRVLILAVAYLTVRGRRRRRHRRALPLLHRHGGRRGRRYRHSMRAGPGDQPVPVTGSGRGRSQFTGPPLTGSFS